ncbi:MAG: alpha-2-macroglobulin family protein [Thermonemataceae bacterium]|nr:alpha-2-macroglobulin family protein [Thermonemataceae bacterium]
MKTFFTLYLFLGIFVSVFAQDLSKSPEKSDFSYIYKLSPKQIENLYLHNWKNIDSSYFSTLIDSFPSSTIYPKEKLASGSYLFTSINKNKLHCLLEVITPIQAHIIDNNRDLQIALTDSKGAIIEDAKVWLNNKKITFNKALHAYIRNRSNKKGILKIDYQGNITIFNLDVTFRNEYDWEVKIHRTFGDWLAKPFRDIKKYKKNKNRLYNSPLWIWRLKAITNKQKRKEVRRFVKTKKEENKSWQGYFVFSKPKYRPKDTLKCKVYFLDYRGKELNEELRVYLEGYFRDDYKKILLKKDLKPIKSGVYLFDFPLKDSLKMGADKYYQLSFQSKNYKNSNEEEDDDDYYEREYDRNAEGIKKILFQYEDYSLQKVNYGLSIEKIEHFKDEQNHLFLSAKDENNLFQLDVSAEIFLFPSLYLSKIDGSEIVIPDTLWHHKIKLDANKVTEVAIPDSLFGAETMDYNVKVIFNNSENQREEKVAYGGYKNEKSVIKFVPYKDSLLIYALNQADKTEKVTLELRDTYGKTMEIKSVTLPYRLPLSEKSIYAVKNKYEKLFYYPSENPLPNFKYNVIESKDSLRINISNPDNLPLWSYILADNKLFLSEFDTKDFSLAFKKSRKTTYKLLINYWWKNKIEHAETQISPEPSKLNINLEVPEKINPGDKVNIKAKVTDYQGQPVENAELAIYGNTAKFAQSSHVIFKNYPKHKSYYKKMYFKKIIEAQKKLPIDWQKWQKHLGEIPYYQFLFPKNNFFLTSHPSKKGVTQIAPYVTSNGNLEPLYYVLLDDFPVFASYVNPQPYSFAADSGLHHLKIRTHNSLITIKNLRLKEKHKNILSVENILDKTWETDGLSIKIEKQKDTLDASELQYLEQFVLHSSENNLWDNFYYQQDDKAVLSMSLLRQNLPNESYQHTFNYSLNYYSLGFFKPNKNITYKSIDNNDGITFSFRSGYQYHFNRGVVMAEKIDLARLKVRPSIPLDMFGEELYTAKEAAQKIEKERKGYMYRETFDYALSDKSRGLGKATIFLPQKYAKNLEYGILLKFNGKTLEQTRIIFADSRIELNQLKNETPYELYLLFADSLSAKISIKAYKNATLYKKIDTLFIQKDDSLAAIMRKHIYRVSPNKSITEDAKKIQDEINGKNKIVYSNKLLNISGRVMDAKTGLPIPGANVFWHSKGGTITDAKGFFTLDNVPENATIQTVAAEYGVAINYINSDFLHIYLNKREALYLVSGRAAGLQVGADDFRGSDKDRIILRGSRSVSGSSEALVILDGKVITQSELAKLNTEAIENVDILKGAVATSIYGASAADGVIIVTTKKNFIPNAKQKIEEATATAVLEGSGLRKNFRDDAVWQPHLLSDRNGEVSFTATFPDDLTRWDIYALAGKEGALFGVNKASIRATKQLTASLSMPRFAIFGDSVEVIGKVRNYTSDSLSIKTKFELDKQNISTNAFSVGELLVERKWIKANAKKDSLRILYALEKEEYTDGEEHILPIYPKGAKETEGFFTDIHKDTSVVWAFDKNKGKVTLNITANLLEVVETELEHLHKYEYLCNEQASSKLLAYLMSERIAKLKGKKGIHREDIKKLVAMLEKNLNQEGLWGWWGISETSTWVTKQVIRALLQAKKQGYSVNLEERVLISFFQILLEKETELPKKVESLEILHSLNADINYAKYIENIEKEHTAYSKAKNNSARLNLQDYLTLQLILKDKKLPYNIDTLRKVYHTTILGNYYWANNDIYYNDITHNAVQTTLKAIHLLKDVPTMERERRLAINYLLEQRKNKGHWLNTYESISVVEMLSILAIEQKEANPEIQLTGALEETIRNFPYYTTFEPKKTLRIDKKGKNTANIYVSAYQEFWNENSNKENNGFEVKTYFAEQDKEKVTLEAGKPVRLFVEISAKETSNFVLVDIPIPAGCEYDSNIIHSHNWDRRKHKVSIFLEKIKSGKNIFELKLLPKYKGIYTLNPAQAEMMYHPTINGREKIKTIEIK